MIRTAITYKRAPFRGKEILGSHGQMNTNTWATLVISFIQTSNLGDCQLAFIGHRYSTQV